MKTDQEEQSVLCWFCTKRPAVVAHTHRRDVKKQVHQVCAICSDRLELEGDFDEEVGEGFSLIYDERYDDYLALLDAFEAANRHRDRDGWLARSIARARQHTLWEAERYEECIAAYDVVEQLGFEQVWYRWGAAHCRSLALEGLGRHDEALATYEEAFRHQEPKHLTTAFESMMGLVIFSANAGKPVDESWRPLIQAIAAAWKVEFPVRPTLAESITDLFELIRSRFTYGTPEPDETS